MAEDKVIEGEVVGETAPTSRNWIWWVLIIVVVFACVAGVATLGSRILWPDSSASVPVTELATATHPVPATATTGTEEPAEEVEAEEEPAEEAEGSAEFNLAADFAAFLDERGMEMAATVDEGDTPVASGATAPRNQGGFAVFGAPENVDEATVLQANGEEDDHGNIFTNTVGFGTQMMFAEPGSILYGPDEDADIVRNNPHGAYISPITQALLESDSARVNVQEGGFTLCTGREMTVRLSSIGVRLDGSDGHNWFLVIRGIFEDGVQDSDLNTTLGFQDYVSGHTQCMMYPPGAYISEEQLLQIAELSHTGGTNCGAEGCSGLSILMLDLNTQAWAVVYQSQFNFPWEFIQSNWFTPND